MSTAFSDNTTMTPTLLSLFGSLMLLLGALWWVLHP
jgi:hypothetical protein